MKSTNPQVSQYVRRLTGDDLCGMFSAAAVLLERNVEGINALNVYPVPDGDTGTNMYLTLRAVMDAAGPLQGASAAAVSETMAGAALKDARGNSGVILSQFFKGVALGLEGTSDFGGAELVEAFHRARERSYNAVGEPAEGTILTVISSVAEAAQSSFDEGGSVEDILDAACSAARDAVARTPTMLAVLREAGVVDAGGQGLAVMLEGVRRYVMGDVSGAQEIAPPAGAVSADFLAATEEELYGYCTQFLVHGKGLDADAIRDRMRAAATSTVVVGDETMVKVHVHTEDPGQILSVAVSHGTLSQVNIQNMDEQHVEFSSARRKEAGAAEVAVVAVASGRGLQAVFSNLGVSRNITGGDTMNPSVQEVLDAVESVPSDCVVILPNNSNIVPAAKQAAERSEKSVRVVSTRSIPQGIAAILAFDSEHDLEANVSVMEEAIESVRTGEVTEAVRSVKLNGVTVESGRLIGLLDRELVVAADDLSEVVVTLAKKAEASGGDLVTLYWGDRITADDAVRAVESLSAALPEVEVELVEGGQPHYHLIMSIE